MKLKLLAIQTKITHITYKKKEQKNKTNKFNLLHHHKTNILATLFENCDISDTKDNEMTN